MILQLHIREENAATWEREVIFYDSEGAFCYIKRQKTPLGTICCAILNETQTTEISLAYK
jgi:hypothetical protein